ncbi:hypothetical protein CesoFtcFv8_005857 [Champsocephalus esox]|uniref:Uncharacterized protein n=1 Tax=Champsocephalus esox TaxID=159716 RepID=A0AAN8CHH6_9TELE|nr:hypothetical protein CesoFtcFv8_005857 [Champsocephalus esox]
MIDEPGAPLQGLLSDPLDPLLPNCPDTSKSLNLPPPFPTSARPLPSGQTHLGIPWAGRVDVKYGTLSTDATRVVVYHETL